MNQISERLAKLSPAKRKLLEQQLRKQREVAEPVAVVAMGCRFPGAPDLAAYWRMIREGLSGIREIPPSRWDLDTFYDPTGETPGKMSVRRAGLVDDVDQFDPLFFGISSREASKMDPQQRILLEVVWEALEQGGLAPEKLAGTATGVFIGIGGTDYSKLPAQTDNYFEHIDAYGGTGNALSIAANRVSYLLDFRGPSVAVDTACSSGLVGVHLAVQALRRRECDTAVAGGVNMILSPETTIAFSKARMLSPDGVCRPFDAAANGYVRGEGCGVVVLKRLVDAAKQGDRILAVLRNTGVNQDGRTSGMTAPNARSQVDVIRATLAGADLGPEKIGYIEAHGTGTPLGDPIEFQALGEIFRRRSPDEPPCYVTSVKANIGHTETVSGVAGLIKVVLMLQHGEIPAQLHLNEINPHIDLQDTRLVIPTARVPWPAGEVPRIAGVSSFGFGGTNSHVIVEAAAPSEVARREPGPSELAAPPVDRPLHLLTLSGKTETALPKLARRYADYLEAEPDSSLSDVCCTAGAGRSHFNHRLAVLAEDREQVRERLDAFARGETPLGVKAGPTRVVGRPKVAFLFTGQGSQYVGMGQALANTQPLVRRTLEQCDEILREHIETPLLKALFPDPGQESPLSQTAYTQPALFALEYALAELWRSWGLEPDALLGHSLGEYVAACFAGVLSLEDALKLVAGRARLMQQMPPNGIMAAVFAPADRVEAALEAHEGRVVIAAFNGPENTVISGEQPAVEAVVAQLDAEGVRATRLVTSHAFHSPLMDPMLDEFEALAAGLSYGRPKIPIASNLTGRLNADTPPDARYWRDHLRNPVRFAEGIERLAERKPHALLEIGPAPVLLGMGRRCRTKWNVAWLPSLRKGQPDWHVMLSSLSEWYLLGGHVDFDGFDREYPRKRLALPTYPFERSRHWYAEQKSQRRLVGGAVHGPMVHPLLGAQVASPLSTILFEARLSGHAPRYLVDHQVQGSPVLPAAAYVEQGLAAAREAWGPGRYEVANVSIQAPMYLPEGGSRIVQVTVSAEVAGERSYEVYSLPADAEDPQSGWTLHAVGKLRSATGPDEGKAPTSLDLDEVRARTIDTQPAEEFYRQMAERGLPYGPAFRVLDDLRRTERDALAEVRLPDDVVAESEQYILHPSLLDACFQSMAGAVPLEADGSYSPHTYLPVGFKRVRAYDKPAGRMFAHVRRTVPEEARPSPESVEGNVILTDESGRVLAELIGVRLARVRRTAAEGGPTDVRDWLYRIAWQEQPLEPAAASDVKPGAEAAPAGAPTTTPTWLLFADRTGVADALAERLRAEGRRCVVVTPGAEFASRATDAYCVDPLSADDYGRLLDEALGAERPACEGVVYLWNLDAPATFESAAQIDEARRLGCGGVLQLVRRLARTTFAKPPGLWLVTRGGQAVGDGEPVAVGQTALWGMGRVAAVELPDLHCKLVDLDPAAEPADAAGALQRELTAAGKEDQIALRGAARYVARLQPAPDALPGDGERDLEPGGAFEELGPGPFRVRLGTPGSMDSLRFENFERTKPTGDQVEIEVRAAGLNFSDVLKALGLYPGITDEIVPLGIECSGVISSVGPEAKRFKPGDRVMGVAPYSFASHAITREFALVPRPDSLTDEEAATVPITYLTAYYGLARLAQLQPGERVLIHAGAGGVGIAAIRIARKIGAEIFATAGSDAKRDFLRSLGVEHLHNTRTLDFADEILEATGGEGVDVVLNSLPGEAIPKSLGILRAYGRFLEIGKTDIYQNRMIGLLPFQDNLSYHAIDLDRMLRQRPEYIQAMFAELMVYFESGDYRPLPLTEFPVEKIVDAFRYMAQRKNIGKVVALIEGPAGRGEAEEAGEAADTAAEAPKLARADGTYLITGGLGALGLRVADWLAGQGAGHLVLLSRREPSAEAAARIEKLAHNGAKVAAVQGDVTDAGSLAAALGQIPKGFPPLRGVVHAAGVLADGVIFEMDLDRLDKAMRPKVDGAWNLHAATLDAPLDFFVMFSSVACVLGSPGQANYAAGNAFLDGLAHYRRSQGLPAVSIEWGPWAETGMAAQTGAAQMKSRGMGLIPPAKGLGLLEGLLRTAPANAAVMDVSWPAMLRTMGARRPMLLSDFGGEEAVETERPGDKVDHAFREKLFSIEPDDRKALLCDYFANELARIMSMDPKSLDVNQPLNLLGLDSLMALELKNSLEARLVFDLPMARFLEGPSIASLAEYVAGVLVDGKGAARAEAAAAAEGAAAPAGPVEAAALGEGPRTLVGAAAERAGPETVFSPLVPLKPGGELPPLFCLHPVGGDVMCYFDLSRNMQEERPVYALRAQGIEATHAPHQSIDAMIDDYLAAIRGVQPEGPYNLCGWSTGGIFAYRMAERLLERKLPLGALVLFDSPTPSIFNHVDLNDDARFLYDLVNFSNHFAGAKMEVSYEALKALDPEAQLKAVLDEAKRHRVLPAEVSAEHLHRLVEVCRAHVRIVHRYKPRSIRRTVQMFRPAIRGVLSEASGQVLDEHLGWGDLLGSFLVRETALGDHFSMMIGDNARRLAKSVAAKLPAPAASKTS